MFQGIYSEIERTTSCVKQISGLALVPDMKHSCQTWALKILWNSHVIFLPMMGIEETRGGHAGSRACSAHVAGSCVSGTRMRGGSFGSTHSNATAETDNGSVVGA